MDSTRPRTSSAAPVARSYQDFVPSSEWVRDQNSDTLLIHLPGFKKEQIKVHIDLHRNLKTSGQSPLNGGSNRWIRFRKDFRIPETLTITGIRAKFENGVLSVILPKRSSTNRPQQELIKPTAAEAKPTTLTKATADEPEAKEQEPEDRKITPEVKEQEKVDDRPEELTDAAAAAGNGEKEQSAQTGGAAVGKASCYGVGAMVLETLRKKSMQQVVIVAVGVVSVGLLMYLTYKSIKGRVVSEISNY